MTPNDKNIHKHIHYEVEVMLQKAEHISLTKHIYCWKVIKDRQITRKYLKSRIQSQVKDSKSTIYLKRPFIISKG